LYVNRKHATICGVRRRLVFNYAAFSAMTELINLSV
jgi:hypothetical protein